MPSIIPKQITQEIRNLCRSINSNESPIFVLVQPDADSIQNDCFFNVERKIEREGGSIVNGWRIAMWPGVFIEAEHHAVWQSPDGDLMDVSLPPIHSQQIVFLRDNANAYDSKDHHRLDNIRKALVNDPIIQRFLDVTAEKAAFIERHSVGQIGHVSMPKREYEEIEERRESAYARVLLKYLRPNDYCICGSGRKVKKCHGFDEVREALRDAIKGKPQ